MGKDILYLLSVSAVPLAINLVFLGVKRVQKELKNVIVLPFGIALLTLILSYFLIEHIGIMGPPIGWLTGNLIMSFIALPSIVRVLRLRSDRDTS